MGYDHNWYLRGPYSPGLTRDAFAAKAELAEDRQEVAGWKLDDDSLQRLARLRDLVEGGQKEELAKRLELLASIHYLVMRRGMSQNDVESLTKELQNRGKECHGAMVQDGIRQLAEHALI